MTVAPLTADAQGVELYLRVQQFYARQMQLLDSGLVTEWATTFTEDGVFAANAHPEPVRGRAAITAAARRTCEQLAREGVTRRHWLGMLTVQPDSDGTVRARCYALVFATPRGGQAALHLSTTCEDVLVVEDGDLLVRERSISRDDLTETAP
jgi:3-phenylpropionate/cinnamic acid dioxygenase small subunit